MYLSLLLAALSHSLSGQLREPQANTQQLTYLQYSDKQEVKRNVEYYWVGWNFVEKRDVYRPKNPKDTLYYFAGFKNDGSKKLEVYEVVPRKGTGVPLPAFTLSQLETKIQNAVMNKTFSDADPRLNMFYCKMKILKTYALAYCDKDMYPVERKLTEEYIDRQWPNLMKYKSDYIKQLANILELLPGSTPTYEEKYVMYKYLKQIDAFDCTRKGNKYDFALFSQTDEQTYLIEGKIGVEGTLSETSRKESEPPKCGK